MNMKIEMKIEGKVDIFDVSEIVHDIEYSTSLKGYPGKLTFKLGKSNILTMSLGDTVEFRFNDLDVFKGYVFALSTTDKEEYSVTAYDQMRYLQNHDYYFTDGTESASDIFTKICNNAGFKDYDFSNKKMISSFKVVNPSNTKISAHTFSDASYFDILQYAIEQTHIANVKKDYESTPELSVGLKINFAGGESWTHPNDAIPATTNRTSGTAKITIIDKSKTHPYHLIGISSNVYGWCDEKQISAIQEQFFPNNNHYYIRDNFGKLEFRALSTELKMSERDEGKLSGETLVIGDESLLMSYDYSIDIDKETHNEIILLTDSDKKDSKGGEAKKLVYATQAGTVSEWGRLRKIVTVKKGATKQELENYAKLVLDVENNPTKSMKLNCLGCDGLYAGNAFVLRLSSLGIMDIPVYILQATHHYEGDNHTMDLEITTEGNFPEGL